MTGKVAPYKKKFGPLPAEVYHLPFPNELHGVSVKQTLDALEFLFRADVEPARVAAIVVEPVQGEGGFYETPTELFQALRKICDDNGIVLIADEVQTGFGRTGKLFAIEHTGVEPDLITMAKSLGGGFPISGVMGKAHIMDAPEPGGLGGTYGGSPIACAAALAVLDVIEGDKLLDRANAVGEKIKARLASFQARNDMVPITAIRGRGAMIGFDIVKSHGAYEPDADATKRVTAAALEAGLVLLSCGVFYNVVRILVPLTVTDEVLEDGLKALETALVAARG
ncbi:MAG: aminotransferase class III-fold pyridoxal phosphate-dependent enzyme, partial [Phyllobacteriaceae bacterium]|nr:aminotransferase class III-fold pyridoxal phosphate-dependent enzyme [Phyllobacteriaceae bacterium]